MQQIGRDGPLYIPEDSVLLADKEGKIYPIVTFQYHFLQHLRLIVNQKIWR